MGEYQVTQLPLNLSGKELKDLGMSRAIDKAERVSPGWKEQAYNFLKDFASKTKQCFMAEDVREASKGYVPEPENKRAWGGIMAKAAHAKIIRKVDIKPVKNPTSHQANATVWQRV